MGYSLAWLAVQGISYGAALSRLSLDPTGELAGFAEREFTGKAIPDDWSLIISRNCDHPMIGKQQLAALSSTCQVVACSVAEHVMFSSAEFWSNGRRIWRVAHDAQQAFDHLVSAGDLPPDFDSLQHRIAEQQKAEGGEGADVDLFFEIPLTLAQAKVGFKHDEQTEFTSGASFQVLAESHPPQSGSPKAQARWWSWK